jgi:hypothetical protein
MGHVGAVLFFASVSLLNDVSPVFIQKTPTGLVYHSNERWVKIDVGHFISQSTRLFDRFGCRGFHGHRDFWLGRQFAQIYRAAMVSEFQNVK